MNRSELAEFSKMLAATMELYDRPVSENALGIWLATLEKFSITDIRSALTAHIQHPERGRFAPKPSDVIAAMQERVRSQWQSADEAWATALQASDERATVVWSEEAAKAFADCQPIMATGDSIGARMAFKASYDRELQQAIRELRTPRHTVSLGHDPAQRVEAVEIAVQRGQLTHDHGERLLQGARREISEQAQAVAGLITGKVIQHPSQKSDRLKMLRELQEKLSGKPPRPSQAESKRAASEELDRTAKAQAKALMERVA